MNDMLHAVWTWLRTRDERGATAVEYGMLVALIAAVIVGIVATVGTDVLNAFTKIANALP
jgi:pilus assembly protein Flp/PilA